MKSEMSPKYFDSFVSEMLFKNTGASFELFLGGQIFFKFFNATGLLKNWKKQHFICSNLTLFVVPFFLFFSFFFSFFSLFSFLSFFFSFFSISLGGGGGGGGGGAVK